MCGIISITGEKVTDYKNTDVDKALLSLKKRGPDDCGILKFPKCILGQTRLSIVDLNGGHQPMRDNKKNIAITFNGEIYNYRELKKDLMEKGHLFSTNSDTEVILKSYIEYGLECPKHLDGMFAFVIWDEEKQVLFITRDRFGKKPLYYAFDENKNLILASEIKAIFETGKVMGIVDNKTIDNYLTLMYVPPWKTVYENIKIIPPASCAIFEKGEIKIKKYWRLEKKTIDITYSEAREKVKKLIVDSVKKRMVADVEIGSFLSGGVDSTLVSILAQSFSKSPIKTFSIGYQNYINELPYAQKAAEKISSEHYTMEAKSDMVSELHEVIQYLDEPHADSSDFPQAILSKFTSQKVKVALSGDGADELFLGYGWYTKHQNLSYRAHFIEKILGNPFSGFIKNIQIFSTQDRKKLWVNNCVVNDGYLSSEIKNSKLSPVDKINLFDITTYLPGQLLTKSDRTGMMNSLEIRSPFLDYKLAEFVYNLPTSFKANKNENKIILKNILSEYMPKEFVYRRKQGFGAPVKNWLKEDNFKKDIHEKIYANDANIFKILKKEAVKGIIDEFYKKNKDHYAYKIWVLYCLELWFIKHKKYHI
ncbi:MAG: asparagine synthase (glutamine-hydrolysing) [Parcubacteria group bacterium LiPW_30]|nr:MAG: asparagine synthase (glutamine-hydrolysing) [Parcubacteria group bacterium LiPW_30]